MQYIHELIKAGLNLSHPSAAKAHEAHALVSRAAETTSGDQQVQFTLSLQQHFEEILFWGATSATIIAIIFFVSVMRKLEERLDPILYQIKKFAPFIMQVTLGTTLLLSAFHGVLFRNDLPIGVIFGDMSSFVLVILIASGGMLVLGILPRVAGFITLLLFTVLFADQGFPVFRDAMHLGEALTISLFGGTYKVMKSNFNPLPEIRRSLELHLHKYKFLLLRIFLGSSLIYSAIYTNYLHGSSTLTAIAEYDLVGILALDPTFWILGALIVEIALGLFFILGFEIRFAAVAYLLFSLFSILFFQQVAWTYIILIGSSLAMFTHGYDRYTLGGYFFKRGNLEPIL